MSFPFSNYRTELVISEKYTMGLASMH